MAKSFDRENEDLGNIVNLGHVNFRVPDQSLATLFYISGLGLTRDPVMMTGIDNMWVNVGDSQFHLPTGPAVVAPGIVIGLVVPELSALKARLERVSGLLANTQFSFLESDAAIETTCPWGNRIRCHAWDANQFGSRSLGMAYVAVEVPLGSAEPIARFYRDVFGARVSIGSEGSAPCALVHVGAGQRFRFQETRDPAPECADFHVQIYIANFSAAYRALHVVGGEIEESGPFQYRFFRIPVSIGKSGLLLDHEVRSMTHPMYGRHLVNRNPAQTTRTFQAGRDFLTW